MEFMTSMIRYALPCLSSLMVIWAVMHKSMRPIIFQRYSYSYLIFLGVLLTWSIMTWKIALKKDRQARVCRRLRRIPILPLFIIGGGAIGILWFFWENDERILHETIMLIGMNRNSLGILCISLAIFALSVLSSQKPVETISNYALLVSSCLVTLLFLETGCRIIAYYDLNVFHHLKQTANIPNPGETVPLGRIIRLHQNPYIIYDLIPNLSVIFRDQPVGINATGFRGKHVPLPKAENAVRIVGIGDSVMFGWGVKDDETYLSVLGASLNKAFPEFLWEVVNTAVPGYNTVMEIETLKEKGLQYTPDIVIIEFVGNDFDLPNFIKEEENYWTLSKSFFKQFIDRITHTAPIAEGLVDAPFDFAQGQYAGNPHQVPEQYKDMVGIEAYRRAMKELQTLSKDHGFKVIVLSWGFPAIIRDICVNLRFSTIEIFPAWKKFVSANNIADGVSAWQLSKDDPHPTVLGHQVIADTLLRYFEKSESIQNLLEMRRKSE